MKNKTASSRDAIYGVSTSCRKSPLESPTLGGKGGSPLIEMKQIAKVFKTIAGDFTALKDINARFYRGEFVSVVGKSGSGKSTLLNVLSGIDRPTSGQVFVGDAAVHTLDEGQTAVWRGRTVGIVFQFFQLLPTLTAVENVMLPMDFCNTFPARQRQARAMQLLEQVGVAEQANKLPAALSGGEQQRVAIARALANDPPILVADEPTGNLDSRTAESVFQLFKGLVAGDKTVLVVTHERDVARWVTRTVTLADGNIVNGAGVGQDAILPHFAQSQETAHG